MKRFAFAAFAVLILGAFTAHMVFAQGINTKSEQVMEETILALLADDTFDAVRDYYGESRLYMNEKLVGVQKVSEHPNVLEAVVQVETFYGAHNPPYGLETITFHIQYDGVTLIYFKHQDE